MFFEGGGRPLEGTVIEEKRKSIGEGLFGPR
jgi:hypothetical protein